MKRKYTFSDYVTYLQNKLSNEEFNHLLKNMSVSDFWIKKVLPDEVINLVKQELK